MIENLNKSVKILKEKIKSPLYKNALYLIVDKAVYSAFGFFFWVIVANLYLTSEVGFASTIISSMIFLAMLATFGFNITLIRFLPNSNVKEEIINSCFTITSIFSLFLSLIFLIVLPFWVPKLAFVREDPQFTFFFVLFTSVWVLTLLIESLFISERIAKYVVIKNLTFNFLKIPLCILLVHQSTFGIFSSWGFASLVAFLVGVLILMPRTLSEYKFRLGINKEVIKPLLGFSFGSYIVGILLISPGAISPLIIVKVLNAEMAAYFYVSWSIAELLFVIPLSISGSLMAEVSTDIESFEKNKKRSVKFMFVLLIPLILATILFADKLLLLFGRNYSNYATGILRLFALSAVPYAINFIFMTMKYITKEVKKVLAISGFIAVVTLGLGYFLMGKIGLIGIAIAWIASNFIITLFAFREIY